MILALMSHIGNGGMERIIANIREADSGMIRYFSFERKPRSLKLLQGDIKSYYGLVHVCLRHSKVILVQSFRLLPLAILARFFFGQKIVYHVPIALRINRFRKMFYRLVLMSIDKIFVSTPEQALSLKKIVIPRDNVSVVPPPLSKSWNDKAVFDNSVQIHDIRRVLFVGRIAEQKGVHEFCSIIKALNKKGHTIEGHIYGLPSNEEVYVKSFFGVVDSDKNLFYHGEAEVDSTLFAGYDLLLFTSKYEGFGLLLAEAMLSGIAIVSTNCKYGPEWISQKGKYFRLLNLSCSVDDWVEVIEKEGAFNRYDGRLKLNVTNYIEKLVKL